MASSSVGSAALRSEPPRPSLAREAQQTIEVLHRAGLFWDRGRLGNPRTIFDTALLHCSKLSCGADSPVQGNVTRLEAQGTPLGQQELLKRSWWGVFACRPETYAKLGALPHLHLAPKEVLRRLRAGDEAQLRARTASIRGRVASLGALAEWDGRPTRCDAPIEGAPESVPSHFLNQTCLRYVAGLVRSPSPPQGEGRKPSCALHRETRGVYRLGDVVERARHQKLTSAASTQILRDFPGSIGATYLQSHGHGANNLTLLHRIISTSPRFAARGRLEAVLHLRTGDTIESPQTTVVDFLCDRNSIGVHAYNTPLLGAYVKPLCYYESAADQLWEAGVRTVHILSGNHATLAAQVVPDAPKSCAYIYALGAFLRHRGFTVVPLLNLSADDGFAAAAQSRYYVPSGGGFSALLAKMVAYKNRGRVVKGGCALLSSDFDEQSRSKRHTQGAVGR